MHSYYVCDHGQHCAMGTKQSYLVEWDGLGLGAIAILGIHCCHGP